MERLTLREYEQLQKPTLDEMISVMEAFRDGKEIEQVYYSSPIGYHWDDCKDPKWNWDGNRYRVKKWQKK